MTSRGRGDCTPCEDTAEPVEMEEVVRLVDTEGDGEKLRKEGEGGENMKCEKDRYVKLLNTFTLYV